MCEARLSLEHVKLGCLRGASPRNILQPTRCCSPVHGSASIRVNLHEQLGDLVFGQVASKVGAQLLTELVDVELSAAVIIRLLQSAWDWWQLKVGLLCTSGLAAAQLTHGTQFVIPDILWLSAPPCLVLTLQVQGDASINQFAWHSVLHSA